MATATDPGRIALSHRQAQARRALAIAALVALYYRKKVVIEDPASLEHWLAIMLPRILSEHDRSSVEGAKYANAIRAIELAGRLDDGYRFEPVTSINREQVATSLRKLGHDSYLSKATEIRRLDAAPSVKSAMLEEAHDVAARRVAGAVMRHVQNGGRRTVERGVRQDPVAMGYVRVTRDEPCFFCAMLASRGLELGGIYTEGAFDESDARFVGGGDAKVHDNCQCSMKPVYTDADEILARNQRFVRMWYELSGEGDADMLTNFRRNYEGRGTPSAA